MLQVTQSQPKHIHTFLIVLLLSLTTLIYLPVRHFDYLAIDDGMHTEVNPRMNPVNLRNILSFWTEPYENAYTPLTYTMWSLEALLGENSPAERLASQTPIHRDGVRLNPGVFHIFNVVFHLSAVLFAYLCLIELFSYPLATFLGALLFAIHPLQVETVAWITGQRDVLAGSLSLACIYYYLRYCRAERQGSPALLTGSLFSKTKTYYLLSFFCFLLSVLAKSSALVVPAFIGVLGLCKLKKKPSRLFLELAPWGLILFPILQVFTSLNNGVAMRVVFIPKIPWRSIIALDAIGFYFSKILAPFSLAMDYGRTPQYVLQQFQYGWTVPLSVTVSLSVGILAWKKKDWVWPFVGLSIFILGLIPVLGFQPFIFQHISTVADRYVYLSLFGASIALAAVVDARQSFFNHQKIVRFGVYVVFLGLGILSALQLRHWKDNFTLFAHTLQENPRSWLAANDLGTYYEGLGDAQRAYELYDQAARLSNIPSAWNNSGAMALELRKYPEAIEAFTRALEASNYSPWAYNNLGAAYAKAGLLKEAKLAYQKARELTTDFGKLNDNFSKLSRFGLAAAEKLVIVRKN